MTFRDLFELPAPRNAQVEAAINVDFTGGLIDPGTLEPLVVQNGVRDCLNVDFLRGGGVKRRQPFKWVAEFGINWNWSDRNPPVEYRQDNLISFFFQASGSSETNHQAGLYELQMSDPPLVVNHDTQLGTAQVVHFGAQVGGLVYLAKWNQNFYSFDGTTWTEIVNPDGDNLVHTGTVDLSQYHLRGMPAPRGPVAVWDGRLWIAGPTRNVENGSYVWHSGAKEYDWTPTSGTTATAQNDMVMFSFPFGLREEEGPRDFHEDFAYRFQGQGNESDSVDALVPVEGAMYVFLEKGIHRLSPYFGEPSTVYYTNTQLSDSLGVAGPNAYVTVGAEVWFWDSLEGLHQITADGQIVNHMGKMQGLVQRMAESDPRYVEWVALGYINGRVWCSVNDGTNLPSKTYVYDPVIQAWTKYDAGFLCFFEYRRAPGSVAGQYESRNGHFGVLCDYAGNEEKVVVELEAFTDDAEDEPGDLVNYLGVTYVEEDFTATTTGDLSDNNLSTDEGGGGWLGSEASFDYNASGEGVECTLTGTNKIAVVETSGREDVVVEATMVLARGATDAEWQGVTLRGVGTGAVDQLTLKFDGTGADPDLVLRDGGNAGTLLDTWDMSATLATQPTDGDTVKLVVECLGDVISLRELWVNGVREVAEEPLFSYTLTGATATAHGAGSGADRYGIYSHEQATGTGERFEYFRVTDFVPTVATALEPMESYVVTSWFDADFPEVEKDWRGVEFFFMTQPDQLVDVKTYVDYDPVWVAGEFELETVNPAVYEGALPSYPTYTETNVDDVVTLEVEFTSTTTIERTDAGGWYERDGWAAGKQFTLTGTNAGTYTVTSIAGSVITTTGTSFTLTTETVTATPLTAREDAAIMYGEAEHVDATSNVPLPEAVRVRRSFQGRALSLRIEPQANGDAANYAAILNSGSTYQQHWALNRFTVYFSRKGLRA